MWDLRIKLGFIAVEIRSSMAEFSEGSIADRDVTFYVQLGSLYAV